MALSFPINTIVFKQERTALKDLQKQALQNQTKELDGIKLLRLTNCELPEEVLSFDISNKRFDSLNKEHLKFFWNVHKVEADENCLNLADFSLFQNLREISLVGNKIKSIHLKKLNKKQLKEKKIKPARKISGIKRPIRSIHTQGRPQLEAILYKKEIPPDKYSVHSVNKSECESPRMRKPYFTLDSMSFTTDIPFLNKLVCPISKLFQKLEILNLGFNGIKCLEFLKELPKLKELDLSGNMIKIFHPELVKSETLENVNLSHNKLWQDPELLEKLIAMKHIKFLTLNNNKITNRNFCPQSAMNSHYENLREKENNFSQKCLGGKSMYVSELCPTSVNLSLIELNLESNRISSPNVLDSLSKFKNLKKLFLSSNPIADYKDKHGQKISEFGTKRKVSVVIHSKRSEKRKARFIFQSVEKQQKIQKAQEKKKVTGILKSFLLKFNAPLNNLNSATGSSKYSIFHTKKPGSFQINTKSHVRLSHKLSSSQAENKLNMKAFMLRKSKKLEVRNEKKIYQERKSLACWNNEFKQTAVTRRNKKKCVSTDNFKHKKWSENSYINLTLHKQKNRIKQKIKQVVGGLDLVTQGKVRTGAKVKNNNKSKLPYLNFIINDQKKKKKRKLVKSGKKKVNNVFITQVAKNKNKNETKIDSVNETEDGLNVEEEWKKFLDEFGFDQNSIIKEQRKVKKYKIFEKLKKILD